MKAVILAGGFGTRLTEETGVRPKPMVEIGGKPMLWHIMRIYSHYGINDFVICCGYKSHYIKEYFANYHLHRSDVTFDLTSHNTKIHRNGAEPWRVTLVETGEDTMTGGRLKRIKEYIGSETFCFTYGDGVTDVNITELIAFHKKQGTLATMTAVQPPGRFGAFALSEDQSKIVTFKEKPKGDGAWINGGYFVLEPSVFDYIQGDATIWEKEPLQTLAHEGQLSVFKYDGYWQNMDTLRDKMILEEQWVSGKALWKVWK
ncbi:glucose-1-phosphate cytidylyltransferase [Candidatus Gottesmanbacteria bacterium RIFCSPHIGHO2_01_FULL_46_14]|uniref:Glucose-1-phosphate cytidylyltransferase n=3 Tax=Microgenomates group TaxID=1794810 RepID=A0A1F5ZQP4_9BACT|nr:MAG: Glucose-1-phosphate cytidylyltransferase [Candidatus Curtissbacteria bacterium GW2011_GWA1_41_11]OGG14703.1 MAG: glucose-1-phosphate cytidylyltransferase [Candidatus Gottesmanbacteria bacterium RIFCSPHIGHO2_01_FULL_46_14]OGG29960.1 MAG: glucose-1-phosphate cytidylyltransferase [Candidatus Gottesmanbacteria bacterium RIFCSPLOWO2_01_FULL_46_21]